MKYNPVYQDCKNIKGRYTMSNVIHFNYSSPSEATYDNKISFSCLTGDLNLCWAESNTLAITNDVSIGAVNMSKKETIVKRLEGVDVPIIIKNS